MTIRKTTPLMSILDDKMTHVKTVKKGTPIGLLLCLTYPADFSFTA